MKGSVGFLFIGLILMISALPVFSETENYCQDESAAKEWEALVKKHPGDIDLQRLHALRLGICQKIEAGSLSFDQGMRMFEEEREKVMRERFEKKRGEEQERTF